MQNYETIEQPKGGIYIAREIEAREAEKKTSYKKTIAAVVVAIAAVSGWFLYFGSISKSGSSSSGSLSNQSKAVGIAKWANCYTPAVDTCLDPDFDCCVHPNDIAAKKYTCRPKDKADECALLSDGTPFGVKVGDWATCKAPKTDVCSAGWGCCVHPDDVSTMKYTCRPMSGEECAYIKDGTPYFTKTMTSGASATGKAVGDWNTCNPKADTCSSGFECCVAPGNLATMKYTCRLPSYCYKFPASSTTSKAPTATGTVVADWNTCFHPEVDTCSGFGFSCCVASADIAINKYTCRNSCPVVSSSSVSKTSTSAASSATGVLVKKWETCYNPKVDTCDATGYKCCVHPNDVGDVVAESKWTCRNQISSECALDAAGNKWGVTTTTTTASKTTTTSSAPKATIEIYSDCSTKNEDVCVNPNYPSNIVKCCVGKGDFGKGEGPLGADKQTCRPPLDCYKYASSSTTASATSSSSASTSSSYAATSSSSASTSSSSASTSTSVASSTSTSVASSTSTSVASSTSTSVSSSSTTTTSA